MDVVEVSPAFCAALAALHKESFGDQAWGRHSLASAMAMPFMRTFVAQKHNQPCGFMMLHVLAPECELISFCVRPSCRRAGIGKRLLREAFALCRDAGIETLFLEVSSKNNAALGLYAHFGFERYHTRQHYYPDGSDGWMMRRLLSSTC